MSEVQPFPRAEIQRAEGAMNRAPTLAAIAEEQLGLQEDPRGSNRGAALQKFFEADNLTIPNPEPGTLNPKPQITDGYPWCAAFVSWCVQEWERRVQSSGFRVGAQFIAPRLAAVAQFPDWARENNCLISKPWTAGWPLRGDIVIFNFSHCGIVAEITGRHFSSVEGNTNKDGGPEGYKVASKLRDYSQVSRFIRLPIPSVIPAEAGIQNSATEITEDKEKEAA